MTLIFCSSRRGCVGMYEIVCVCTLSLSTSLCLQGSVLFRSGPSTASQSWPASILSPPRSWRDIYTRSSLCCWPTRLRGSCLLHSTAECQASFSWSLLFCRKGLVIERACVKMEMTLQVLSTGDKVKRAKEKTECRGWRGEGNGESEREDKDDAV